MGCYIWYSKEGTGQSCSPPTSLLAVPNATAHLSTASVPITTLLYNGPLLCSLLCHKGLMKTNKFLVSHYIFPSTVPRLLRISEPYSVYDTVNIVILMIMIIMANCY